jgi:hypothetical protein
MSERSIVIYTYQDKQTLLDVHELSRFVGVQPALIRKLFRLGLIDPIIESPELLFEDTVIERIDKIMRFRNDLGVNFAGCALVLDLLERIADLEKRLLYYEMKFNK